MLNKTGGGIMIPNLKQSLSKEIFKHYLNNFNKITIISFGRYGIVVLLTLPDNLDYSNEDKFYKQMSPNENYGKIVKSLLIKIQFVNSTKNLELTLGDHTFSCVTEGQIQDETNIQTDIFFKTVNFMQPLCPSIIYAEIIKDYSEKNIILNLLKKADNLPFPIENNIIFNNDIGIIVMEMIHNSNTLFHYIYEKNENIDTIKEDIKKINNSLDQKYINSIKDIDIIKREIQIANNISRYALLKLALETGYNHNDFHKGNILIQQDKTYFKDIEFSPILIDFGRTTKLNLDILNSIKEKIQQKNYIGALAELCKPYNSKLDHTKILNYKYYSWVCGNYDGQILNNSITENDNIMINDLFEKRELAIDENIHNMSKLHDADPNKYPLLPLANNIKNNLYNGMIGGLTKRKIKSRKNKRNKINKRNKNKTNNNKTNKTIPLVKKK
uniref:Protein kinase domain-containing protein n=1 Tax=viral metagenome TaxID=1070528 RepID=A0A6C0KPT1_9ZZZZ